MLPTRIFWSRRRRVQLLAEAFEVAQWAGRTAAGVALAQMAARRAAGKGDLARLIRERQDLAAEAAGTDTRLSVALAQSNDQLAERLRAEILDYQVRLKSMNERLAKDFPEFVTLVFRH
jgi:hypothetical protein